jgi:hypothetical protein
MEGENLIIENNCIGVLAPCYDGWWNHLKGGS